MLIKIYIYLKIWYNIIYKAGYNMKMHLKIFLALLGIFVIVIASFCIYLYMQEQKSYESANICQNDDLISKLIVDNVNPFSKFKFIKKRNEDCNKLLIEKKDDALMRQDESVCSVLDSSANSVTMLVYAYVNDMYDRETASKELSNTSKLMTPYNYCPAYFDNMITLIKIKKRMGL